MKKTLTAISIITLTFFVLFTQGCGGDDKVSAKTDTTQTPTVPTVTAPQQAGWYASTEVRATANDGSVYEHTTAGVFGELAESSDTLDKHDIAAYGPAILRVVFLQDGLDNTTGYFSDYQHFDENSTSKKVWTFQVRNDKDVNLASAAITLSLKGINNIYYGASERIKYDESKMVDTSRVNELTLIDVDNQISYTVNELSTAGLNMDNLHVRTFRWVLGSVDANDFTPPLSPSRVSALSAMKMSNSFVETPKMTGTFGLPPQQ